jgi:hypothetical protein
MQHKNVFIDAAPTVSYGQVVDAMDWAKSAGAAKVALAKLKPSGPAQPNSVAPGALPRAVMIGSPIAIGSITEKAADKAFKPYVKRLESCYFPLLASSPDSSGRMMLRFTVGPDGKQMIEDHPPSIQSSTVEPVMPQLEECVDGLLASVTFEPLGEGKTAIVQYPVLFSPG